MPEDIPSRSSPPPLNRVFASPDESDDAHRAYAVWSSADGRPRASADAVLRGPEQAPVLRAALSSSADPRSARGDTPPDARHGQSCIATLLSETSMAMNARAERLLALCGPVRPLNARAVRVEDLARLASRIGPYGLRMSDMAYARCIAQALRMIIASVPAACGSGPAEIYLPDVEIRRRFDSALNGLAHHESHAIAANLLTGWDDGGEGLRYLRDCVERQGTGRAEQAMLGRRFTILCEAVACRVPHGANDGALASLNGWDWNPCLSLHHAPAHRPGLLAGMGWAAYRGVRRLVVAAMAPEEAAQDRVREAREGVARASLAFMQACVRACADMRAHAQAFGQTHAEALAVAGGALTAARERYDAACAALGDDPSRALRAPSAPARIHEAGFLDVLAHMPGDSVDTLGRYCERAAGISLQPESLRIIAHMQNALLAERAIRAGAEVVRALMCHVARREGAPIPQAVLRPGDGGFAVDPAAAAGRRQTLSIQRQRDTQEAREAERLTLLTHIRVMEQRFRQRDRSAGVCTDSTLRAFVRAGVARLSAAERDSLRDAVCDPDWRPPAWLAGDELWLGIIRAFQ